MGTWLLLILCIIPSISFAAIEPPEPVRLATEGRAFLEQHKAGFRVKQVCEKGKGHSAKRVCKTSIATFNVALAIKRRDEPFQVVLVDGATCASKTVGFTTMCHLREGKTNGVNTTFEVVAPFEYDVYAIRRVITTAGGFTEVTYTPYAPFLNTPEVRKSGKEYLGEVIDIAYQDLEKLKVRSLSSESEYIYDRVPKEVIEQLILIEHIDHKRFLNESMVDLVKEIYTIIGVNQGLAYNYAKSGAAARGLLQVIPSTYKSMRRVYPHAALIPEFVKGMTNHANAIKAAILLADHDVGIIPTTLRGAVLGANNIARYRDYVSCAYNGGPARSLKLLKSGRDHVRDNRNPENRIYVAKMRSVAQVALQAILPS